MQIPAQEAIIAREKLTQYLLVPRLEDDKSKFLAQGGFTLENPDDLEGAIRSLPENHDTVPDRSNEYGDYYGVVGSLVGVNGRILNVVTVWIVRLNSDGKFRFVTLHPSKD